MSAPAGEQLLVNIDELKRVHEALVELGGQFREAREMAAQPTTHVQPPGNDPVSVTMAEVISAHGVQAQQVLERGEQVHDGIVAELANAIQTFEDAEHEGQRIMAGRNEFGGFGDLPQGGFGQFPSAGNILDRNSDSDSDE